MPRFNAAKSWKKLDDDLSGKFNYLCDLLDEGYSSVALINNHEIAIDINPKDGIKIVNDGSSIFSLDPLTGEIVIGKYDGLISDLETDLGTAYNDIAQQLGYTDYDDMVAEAIAGNTIINGGWLRTSLIQANTILFDQLASSTFNTINYLSGNLIQNVTMEKSMDRWTGDGTLVDSTYEGLTIKAIQLYSNTANTWAYSDYFRVDPSKAYEVSFWVKKSDSQGNIYIGTNQRSSGGAIQTVTSVNAYTGGVVSTTDSNFYFAYCTTGNSPTDWVRVVGYIMPAGTPADKCKGLGEYGGTMGNPKVAILHADIYEMRVRVGNYANTSATYVHVANMKVTQVDAQAVIKMVQSGVSYAGVVINATNGFVSTATIDSQTITTKSNSTEGFSIYNGTDKVFGVDTDGALFASRIAYIDNPERYYGIIGDFPGAGTGLALFDADESANAYVKMGAIYDGSGNLAGFGFANIDSVLRMYFGNGATEILNATGTKGILTYLDSTNEIYIMYGGASAHGVGADSTGPYYIKSGTKTYF